MREDSGNDRSLLTKRLRIAVPNIKPIMVILDAKYCENIEFIGYNSNEVSILVKNCLYIGYICNGMSLI